MKQKIMLVSSAFMLCTISLYAGDVAPNQTEPLQGRIVKKDTASTVKLKKDSISTVKTKIEFDTKTFQCGTFTEGKTDKLSAVFTVKNVGNAVLKLESVRPGCGCTVVKFDSLIQPGKSSKIEASVNIKGYRSGTVSKSITVTSNAENEPTARLTIEAKIQGTIDVSETYMGFDSSNVNKPKILSLATKKTDLKISSVDFQSTESHAPKAEWQSNLKLPLKYKVLPKDSTRTDGYKVFLMEIYAPPVDKTQSGQIMIKTNHPEKQEITIQAHFQFAQPAR